jgi:hypothetical protein
LLIASTIARCSCSVSPKKDQANLSRDDERDLKDYGALLLALDAGGIGKMLAGQELTEVEYGNQT